MTGHVGVMMICSDNIAQDEFTYTWNNELIRNIYFALKKVLVEDMER